MLVGWVSGSQASFINFVGYRALEHHGQLFAVVQA